jgi:hypothetical protein
MDLIRVMGERLRGGELHGIEPGPDTSIVRKVPNPLSAEHQRRLG